MRSEVRNGDLRFSVRSSSANPAGDVVLFIHGFPDDSETFSSQMTAVGDAGYRALAPTIRGYEPSSQPVDGDYSLISLAGDVVAWLDDLEVEKAHLVGHDWGAAIAYVAGASSPERFLSLTTIAVPHVARIPGSLARVPTQVLKSWYMTFFQLRWIADRSVARKDWALLKRLWRSWSPGLELDEERWSALTASFEAPGVKQAMLAYYRQNATPLILLGLRKTDAMRLTSVPVRTLAITGTDDGCMDTRLFDLGLRADDFPNGIRVERLEGVGHFAHLEDPERVNRLILDWIEKPPR